ncbi:hypothetical protein ACXVUM_10915 [Williamsia sp. SKLECPSW1]
MVNSNVTSSAHLWLRRVVLAYSTIAVGTVVALAIVQSTAPRHATPDAWVHAAVVAVFALVLPLRLPGIRAGNRRALRAVGIISGVLVAVNAVEASIPGFVPAWMRVEMVVIALVMLASVGLVVTIALAENNGGHEPIRSAAGDGVAS